MTESAPGPSLLRDLTSFVVAQQPRTLDGRTGYRIANGQGAVMASVVEVGASDLDKLAHPGRSRKRSAAGVPEWLVKSFEVRSGDGAVLLVLTRIRQAKKTLVVSLAGGAEIGQIRQENLFGRARLAYEVDGARVGGITSDGGWLRLGVQGGPQRFTAASADGEPVARLTMTRVGNVHLEVNEYEVEVLRPLEDPLHALVVASAVAVDQALFEG